MHCAANNRHSGSAAKLTGFTLTELMLVAAAVSILCAIAYPSYLESIRKARRQQAWGAMLEVMQQQERHHSLHGSYLTFSALQPNGFRWFSGSTASSSAYEISAASCDEKSLRDCVLLTASPGTRRVNHRHRDPDCGQLTLNSRGMRGASGTAASCW